MRYGVWLRRQREANILSQGQLAELAMKDWEGDARLDRTYVSKIERGEVKMPGRELRHRLNDVLGVENDDPEYLRTLPIELRMLEVDTDLPAPAELSPGQRIDRALLFATDRERDIIERLARSLDELFPTGDE